MLKSVSFGVAVLAASLGLPLGAWSDGGHMLIAYIAYQNLTPTVRARADHLLTLNPLYSTWTAGVPVAKRGLTAFLRAATWADCIKFSSCAAGFVSDGGDVPPGDPTDAQNIGYSDHLMHRYWHFVDLPFSAGAAGAPARTPNALTEIQLLTAAIASGEAEGVESYDLAWLLHLAGDIHQPLHSTSRFTKNHPGGDAGGNLVHFCTSPCTDELHGYWDHLLGVAPTVAQVITDGKKLLKAGAPAGSDQADPSEWAAASEKLAEAVAYAPPISADDRASNLISPRPNAAYAAKALQTARSQALLAGFRLAALLNANLR